MTCQYCRAQNDNRRTPLQSVRTADNGPYPVQMTAAVPDLETVEMPAPPPLPLRPQLVTEAPPKRSGQPRTDGISGKPVRAHGSGPPAAASADLRRSQSVGQPGTAR